MKAKIANPKVLKHLLAEIIDTNIIKDIPVNEITHAIDDGYSIYFARSKEEAQAIVIALDTFELDMKQIRRKYKTSRYATKKEEKAILKGLGESK